MLLESIKRMQMNNARYSVQVGYCQITKILYITKHIINLVIVISLAFM